MASIFGRFGVAVGRAHDVRVNAAFRLEIACTMWPINSGWISHDLPSVVSAGGYR